jgi:hypothetical protein
MWKWLNDVKVKIGLVIAVIAALSQVPASRDAAAGLVGLALAKDTKKVEQKIDSTDAVLQEMILFQSLLFRSMLEDTMFKRGADSTTVDTFMKMYDLKWDTLLKKMKKDS